MFDLSVYYMYLQYFDTVGWVFWPVKTVSRITYIVLDLKHRTIQLLVVVVFSFVNISQLIGWEGHEKVMCKNLEIGCEVLWVIPSVEDSHMQTAGDSCSWFLQAEYGAQLTAWLI